MDSFKRFERNVRVTTLDQERDITFKIKRKLLMCLPFKMLGLHLLANKFPAFYETFLIYHFPVGGIIFELEVVKNLDKNGNPTAKKRARL